MIVKRTNAVWSISDGLRQRMDTGVAISALSQFLVIVELARRDDIYRGQLQRLLEPGNYIKDLLTATITSLEVFQLSGDQELIDMDDECWSALPADAAIRMIIELIESTNSSQELASTVLTVLQKHSRQEVVPPQEVLLLMRKLLGETSSLYLPFDGSAIAGLYMAEPDQYIKIRVQNKSLATILRRLYFSIGHDVDLEIADPFVSSAVPGDTATFLIPPLGKSFEKTFAKIVESGLPDDFKGPGRLMSEEAAIATLVSVSGRMVALVSSGTLFRGGRSRRFRQWLVQEAGLTAVVELPERLLEYSPISTAVLLIDPHASQAIRSELALVSGNSDKYLTEVGKGRFSLTGWQELGDDVFNARSHFPNMMITTAELTDNDFILQPSRYRVGETSGLDSILSNRQTVPLSAIADLRSPLPIRTADAEISAEFGEVRISDFNDDSTITKGSKLVRISKQESNRIERQVLRAGDILIGTKGTIGKAAVVSDSAPSNLVAGQTTVLLRLKNSAPINDPVYLLRYLALPEVRAYLDTLAGGATISFIRTKDLAELPVPVLADSAQWQVVDVHSKILGSLKEAAELQISAQNMSDHAFDVDRA